MFKVYQIIELIYFSLISLLLTTFFFVTKVKRCAQTSERKDEASFLFWQNTKSLKIRLPQLSLK